MATIPTIIIVVVINFIIIIIIISYYVVQIFCTFLIDFNIVCYKQSIYNIHRGFFNILFHQTFLLSVVIVCLVFYLLSFFPFFLSFFLLFFLNKFFGVFVVYSFTSAIMQFSLLVFIASRPLKLTLIGNIDFLWIVQFLVPRHTKMVETNPYFPLIMSARDVL